MLIKNSAPRIVGFGGLVRLLPGINEVDATAWEQVKDREVPKWYLSEGLVEVVYEPNDNGKVLESVGDGSQDNQTAIKKLSAKKAVEVIEETYDPALLDEWAASEKRKPVLKALQTQIQSMKL